MGLCPHSTHWLLIVLVLALAIASVSVLGGPDHSISTSCANLYKSLNYDERHAVRDAIQDLQAIESYLGHLRLGRPLPLSSVPIASPSVSTLAEWKSRNTTKLDNVLNVAGVAGRLGISIEDASTLAFACMSSRLRPDGFTGRPVVSILLNYFKRPHVITRLAANMRASCASASVPCEMVVNVDNPEEAGAWAQEAGFIVPVFSANLHETLGYNRAARLARGKYLVIWQDDQVPPKDGRWLVNMIKLFETYPQLAILGMNSYRLCKQEEPTNRWGMSPWDVDPVSGVRWTYAQTVDFAPMAIRAPIFEEVGGLDEGLSRRGDCGIWGDWEISARVTQDGWLVGSLFLEGRTGDGEPGTTHKGSNGEKCWGRQQYVASSVYRKRYGVQALDQLSCERVWLFNMVSFQVQPGSTCPYGVYETRFGNCSRPPEAVAAAAKAELEELAAAARMRTGINSGVASVLGDQGAGAVAAKADPATVSNRLGAGVGAEAGSAAGNEAWTVFPSKQAGSPRSETSLGAIGNPREPQSVGASGANGLLYIDPVLVRTAGSDSGRKSMRRW